MTIRSQCRGGGAVDVESPGRAFGQVERELPQTVLAASQVPEPGTALLVGAALLAVRDLARQERPERTRIRAERTDRAPDFRWITA
mgnify:CR=1 FL=1